MTRFLAARVRKAYTRSGHCALWVDCRYVEPFGAPRWAVVLHHLHRDGRGSQDHEVARSRWLWLALWRAWRAA